MNDGVCYFYYLNSICFLIKNQFMKHPFLKVLISNEFTKDVPCDRLIQIL